MCPGRAEWNLVRIASLSSMVIEDYIRGERMVLPMPSARLFAISLGVFTQAKSLDKLLIALRILAP
jgi:hypothetical protein